MSSIAPRIRATSPASASAPAASSSVSARSGCPAAHAAARPRRSRAAATAGVGRELGRPRQRIRRRRVPAAGACRAPGLGQRRGDLLVGRQRGGGAVPGRALGRRDGGQRAVRIAHRAGPRGAEHGLARERVPPDEPLAAHRDEPGGLERIQSPVPTASTGATAPVPSAAASSSSSRADGGSAAMRSR